MPNRRKRRPSSPNSRIKPDAEHLAQPASASTPSDATAPDKGLPLVPSMTPDPEQATLPDSSGVPETPPLLSIDLNNTAVSRVFAEEGAEGINYNMIRPGKWRIRWRIPNTRRWGSLQVGLTTYAEALAAAKLKAAELGLYEAKTRHDDARGVPRGEKRVEVLPMIDAWASHAHANRRADDSVYAFDCARGLKAALLKRGIQYFDQISNLMLEDIVTEHRSARKSPYGYRIIRWLKKVVRYVVGTRETEFHGSGRILFFPLKKWRCWSHKYLEPPIVNRILEFLKSENGADKLPKGVFSKGVPDAASMARARETVTYKTRIAMYPAVFLASRYGCRPKEICNLNVGDWDPATCILTIRLHKTVGSTSAQQDRSFPVDPETAALLTIQAGKRFAGDPLFRTARCTKKSLGRWLPDWFTRKYAVIARSLGIDSTIYDLRHTVATNLYWHYSTRGRGGIAMVKAILGHTEKSQVSSVYVHLMERRLNLRKIAADYARSATFYLESLEAYLKNDQEPQEKPHNDSNHDEGEDGAAGASVVVHR